MNISVIGRQFAITPAIRTYVEEHLRTLADDAALKVSSVSVVMVREKNRFTTTLVLNCKFHTFKSEVEDFDLYRSFDSAQEKVERQLYDLCKKIREHQAVPLCDMELARAETVRA